MTDKASLIAIVPQSIGEVQIARVPANALVIVTLPDAMDVDQEELEEIRKRVSVLLAETFLDGSQIIVCANGTRVSFAVPEEVNDGR